MFVLAESSLKVETDPVSETYRVNLDIHQQDAQITNEVQSALYHSQTLHMFRLFMSHHQGCVGFDYDKGLIAPC
jgi:hypothetical protein